VATSHGLEAYGVLVAPSHDHWRARVVTYPNILWTIPGGSCTLKFVGDSPQLAESRAIAFVEDHIAALGYARYEAADSPAVGRINAEAKAGVATTPADPRKVHAVPVRFGVDGETFIAMTNDLSVSGLFVATLAPLDPGRRIRILMDLDAGPVAMEGDVVWQRVRHLPGRPAGMGVHLIAPPKTYLEYVRSLP
jgi:hypothetical protein